MTGIIGVMLLWKMHKALKNEVLHRSADLIFHLALMFLRAHDPNEFLF